MHNCTHCSPCTAKLFTVEQCVRASVHEDSHPPTEAQFAELHIEDSHADRGASWLVTWSEISQVGQHLPRVLSFNHVTERDIEEGWSCGHFATSVHLITFLYALYTKYTTNGDDGVRQLQ